MKVYVFLSGYTEQKKACELLQNHGYHWKSGQEARDIPELLNLAPYDEIRGMIIALDTEQKIIKYFPAEVYGKTTDLPEEIREQCISVDDLYENLKECY